MTNKAFLFDLNGTIIDDMVFHVEAWSQMLNEDLQHPMGWDEVKSHMYGKSEELYDRIFGPNYFEADRLSYLVMEKERRYQKIYQPHLKLIDGLGAFLEKSKSLEIPMAIGSAAIPFNIDFVIDNLSIRHYFKAIVSADDVKISKPHPETFLNGAALLHVKPEDCIVFEDAPKGVEAAFNAGMKTVVILSELHNESEFAAYPNIIKFIRSYSEIQPAELIK